MLLLLLHLLQSLRGFRSLRIDCGMESCCLQLCGFIPSAFVNVMNINTLSLIRNGSHSNCPLNADLRRPKKWEGCRQFPRDSIRKIPWQLRLLSFVESVGADVDCFLHHLLRLAPQILCLIPNVSIPSFMTSVTSSCNWSILFDPRRITANAPTHIPTMKLKNDPVESFLDIDSSYSSFFTTHIFDSVFVFYIMWLQAVGATPVIRQ